MHILLTDLLACPRCGPEFGLIVLADRLDERRIVDGLLGCPNCRNGYSVTRGVADLRREPSPPAEWATGDSLDPEERAFRTAALLGVAGPSPTVLVIEPGGGIATLVAGLLKEAHVVGSTPGPPPTDPGEGMLSRIMSGARLPFRSGSLRAAAVLGAPSDELLREVVRCVVPGGRVVVDDTPDEVADTLVDEGLEVLLRQDGVTVAARPGPR